MIKVTSAQILHLGPNARASYQQAFADADAVLSSAGVNANALRLAHFMAQVLHETGGLTVLVENMNYSAQRLVKVWPKRFPTLQDAVPYAHNPQKLANKVYNGRMGNRTGTDDGWNYRGRGLLQITGREDYERYGSQLGVDLLEDPDRAYGGDYALRIAAAEWDAKNCNPDADQDNITRVARKINGGLTGIAERKDWLVKTKALWH